MQNLPAPATSPEPRARGPNRNGWTAARQAAFIEALGLTTSVKAAAERVGMTPQSAFWLRRQAGAEQFSEDWDAALAIAWEQVEATALDRVLNGETLTFEQEGSRFTRHRPCAPSLLIHMIGRAVLAREKAEVLRRQPDPDKVDEFRREIRRLAATNLENRLKSENHENLKPDETISD